MPEFQLTLSDPKTRKSVKLDIKDPKSQLFMGLKIGDTIDASGAGVNGKIKITGGSDRSGTPMRVDLHGGARRHVLLGGGPGLKIKSSGFRRRKVVRGNTVTADVYQINAALVEGELPAPQAPAAEEKPAPAAAKPGAKPK